MSNAGQGILAVAGFAIGSLVGFPQLGFVVGSLVGQALFPTQLPGVSGPRLTDTRTTAAQLGGPVQEVHGTEAVAGTVMWMGPIQEVATQEEVGGKGGPSQTQTTYAYYQSIAVGLCRAHDSSGMGGISRIWENGALVYDARPQQAGESVSDYNLRLTASDQYAEGFTLYLGDETQLADPTIELQEGVGNVPAFRGLMYIVYPDRQLRNDQGLRHPNFKFEVYEETAAVYSQSVVYPWIQGEDDPRNPDNVHYYETDTAGVWTSDFAAAVASREASALLNYIHTAQGVVGFHRYTATSTPAAVAEFGPWQASTIDFNVGTLGLYFPTGAAPTSFRAGSNEILCSEPQSVEDALDNDPDPKLWFSGATYYDVPTPNYWTHWDPGGSNPWQHGTYTHVGIYTTNNAPDIANPGCVTDPDYVSIDGLLYGPAVVQFSGDIAIAVRREPQAPAGAGWELDTSATFKVLQAYDVLPNGRPISQPVGPAVHPDDANYDDEAFWTAAYADAVADGTMDAGLVYGADYPATQNFAYRRGSGGDSGISLATIVRRICARNGLTAVDVSDLEDRYVRGYVVSRVMTGRDAIEPLRMVGFFDYVESDQALKFVVRGKAAVRTLDASDLGAYDLDGEAVPAISTKTMQDPELPRQVRLHYRAVSRDYEDGEQPSPVRLTTNATNVLDVECPVALDDDQAAQVAEVIWADAWAGRWTHTTTVDHSQLDLEPADPIIVPIDNRLERVRIVNIDDQLPYTRRLELVRDDDGSYVSVAISEAPARAPAAMTIYSATNLYLLDLPALRAEDDDAGFYVAAKPVDPARTWPGASIYRSTDGGSSFGILATLTNAATIGTINSPLPAGDPAVWDVENVLTVTLASGSFESATDAEVFAGANAIAIGAHGRWELLQFATAVQVSTNVWELSRLLRGRRGTEHNMGTGQTGDRAVLVSGAGIIRLTLLNSQIGVALDYKAVTVGAAYGTGTDQTFTGDGEALVPFSPAHISGTRQDNGDIVLSLVRRDRLGDTLQDGAEVPMSEASLSFEWDIYSDDSPPAVVRTITTASLEVTYTAAEIAADFGSPPPASIFVMAYQRSAVVGRGNPGEALI